MAATPLLAAAAASAAEGPSCPPLRCGRPTRLQMMSWPWPMLSRTVQGCCDGGEGCCCCRFLRPWRRAFAGFFLCFFLRIGGFLVLPDMSAYLFLVAGRRRKSRVPQAKSIGEKSVAFICLFVVVVVVVVVTKVKSLRSILEGRCCRNHSRQQGQLYHHHRRRRQPTDRRSLWWRANTHHRRRRSRLVPSPSQCRGRA